jgi:hypothetical protein
VAKLAPPNSVQQLNPNNQKKARLFGPKTSAAQKANDNVEISTAGTGSQ